MHRTFIAASTLIATSLSGCAVDDLDPVAEDAVADAAPAGKADSAFPLGWHHAFDIDYEKHEPLHALFHEDGSMDYTRFINDDYETRYSTGTFKVYRYAGRDRVRLTDAHGRVVLRSDWSVDDDGDLLLGEERMYEARPAASPAGLVRCTAMRVHDTGLLEEGFTEYEYPDFSIKRDGSSYELDLGSGGFDAGDGTITHVDGEDELVVTLDRGDERLEVRVDKAEPRRGVIDYTERADDPMHLMASLVCR